MVKNRAAIWSFSKLTALYFTMSDIVHKVLGIVMKELPDVSKNILRKKSQKNVLKH